MVPVLSRAFCRMISVLGLGPATKLVFAQRIEGRFYIRPHGYRSPLLVRGATSDPDLMYSIFCLDEYPLRFVRDVHFVIDAGANVGYASVYFAHHYPDAEIIAIEPDASNFECLLENIKAYPKIRPVNGALWPRREKIAISNPSADKWAFQCVPDAAGSIEAFTVEDLVLDHPKIDLFKCDIEGAEKELLAGNTAWLGKIKTMMIEIHPGCWKSVFQSLAPYDYDCRQSGETVIVNFAN